jgi:CheY-like chemotaxis protein
MFEKILIVEDDSDMRLAITDKLLLLHYEIIQAEDGEQAIAKFISHKPNLMILDLMLPKMGGFEVLSALKDELDMVKTPVVIYSNLDKPESIEKAKELNVNDFMLKAQSQIEDVCQRVQSLLGQV